MGESKDGAPGTDSYTTSLASDVMKFHMENGRTYHSYREGKYAIPNDTIENNRLDLQHALFNLTLDGKLGLAPVQSPQRCLDIGTGTGIWAIDYAEANPGVEVTAVDLSPIQPTNVPTNVRFLIDDVEDEWTYGKNHFDYIHSRQMAGAVQDWDLLLQNCIQHLKPGGWVELQDVGTLECDDGQLANSALKQWWDLVALAFEKLRRPMVTAHEHRQRLVDAGFVEVKEVVYQWPINTWPKGGKLRDMGMWSRENISQALEGMSIAPLTRALGWTADEVGVLVERAKADLSRPGIHAYFKVHFVYGQKPGGAS